MLGNMYHYTQSGKQLATPMVHSRLLAGERSLPINCPSTSIVAMIVCWSILTAYTVCQEILAIE